MIRLFEQHEIRRQKELAGMWRYVREDGAQYSLPVPGCIEQHPRLMTWRGKGAFEKKISCGRRTNLRLEFKGVSHTADVFFDGRFVMHHYNAYTGFAGVVKGVEPGMHEIRVETDNSFGEASALHVPNDYYTYGGITRPVVLEELGDLYIRNLRFTPALERGVWHAGVEAEIENLTDVEKAIRLEFALTDPETGDVLQVRTDEESAAGETANGAAGETVDGGPGETADGMPEEEPLTASLTLGPGQVRRVRLQAVWEGAQAWCPDSPKLYLLRAVLYEGGQAIDDLTDRVGFRQIRVSGNRILLNGEPVFLKGFNRHEDCGPMGCAIPPQFMVQDLELMWEAGANAVRTCHYPNDERFLDLCDERGMLVWEENHARGLGLEQMCNPHFDGQCRDCIREMIEQHGNHPSIVIWGILNECASETEAGRQKYREQLEQIRRLDASRPATFATCRHFTDICLDLPDVVSFNLYAGWYEDVPVKERYEREMAWIAGTGGAGKPVIVSEFGAGAVYGYRDRSRCKWSEERQADVIRENLEVFLEDDGLSGVFLWQFADCRVTEEEWFSGRPRCHNNKGVVDEYRRPKEAFDVVRRLYAGREAKDRQEGPAGA